MAMCKDCVHVEVCRFKDLPAPLSDSYIRESECIEKRCGDFKDRSRFVELPCKVGDRVYVALPKAKLVVEYVIESIWVEEAGAIVRAVDTTCFTFGFFMADEFGKKLFFTKEEAEQALKEREENA